MTGPGRFTFAHYGRCPKWDQRVDLVDIEWLEIPHGPAACSVAVVCNIERPICRGCGVHAVITYDATSPAARS